MWKFTHSRPATIARIICAATLLGGIALCPVAGAQPPRALPEPNPGIFITVHNPITSSVVNRVKTSIERFAQDVERRRATIVFDFNPDGRPSSTAEYGPCRDLADAILGLHDVNTVAFVHNQVAGHAVLPVLACKEIVMSSAGQIGDGLRGQPERLGNDQRVFYENLARGRGRPPALILKMVDRDMEVIEGTRGGAVWYIDRRDEEAERQDGFVARLPRQPILHAGSIGQYNADLARQLGLCKLKAENRQDVAREYNLPPTSLREDPLQGRTPIVWRVEIKGALTPALVETTQRRINRAIAEKANVLIVQLECGGGEPKAAHDLAYFLYQLKDDADNHAVFTIAYLTKNSRDTALIPALACSEIVLDQKTIVGDFEGISRQHPGYHSRLAALLKEIPAERGYSTILINAMFDREMAVHLVESRHGQYVEPVDQRSLEEDRARPADERQWKDDDLGLIKAKGEWLKLSAQQARNLQLTRHAPLDDSAGDALAQLYALYGFERVRMAGGDWLDSLSQFLRQPWVTALLIMIGISCLMMELKLPGFGLPGVSAAVCFVLYFWAHSQLAGQMTALAVLLFLLGLLLLAVEVFLIPGFGVTGVSGIICVIAGLGLVAVVNKPETTSQYGQLMDTVGTFAKVGLAMVGGIVLALLIARRLPHVPFANRLVLTPPSDQDGHDAAALSDEAGGLAVNYAALLGAVGETATTLRPAGKVRFGDDIVDVIAEGSYIQPGARVQVIEIEGNRVVVKEI